MWHSVQIWRDIPHNSWIIRWGCYPRLLEWTITGIGESLDSFSGADPALRREPTTWCLGRWPFLLPAIGKQLASGWKQPNWLLMLMVHCRSGGKALDLYQQGRKQNVSLYLLGAHSVKLRVYYRRLFPVEYHRTGSRGFGTPNVQGNECMRLSRHSWGNDLIDRILEVYQSRASRDLAHLLH